MQRIIMCLLVCGIVLLSGCTKQPTDEELGRKEVLPDDGCEQIKAMPTERPADAPEWIANAPRVEIPALPVNRIVPIVRPVTFTFFEPFDPYREITRRDVEIKRLEEIIVLLNKGQIELLHMPRECPLNDEGDDE